VLSAQDLVSCDRTDLGCNGGWLDNSWHYIENVGVMTEECFPYQSMQGSVPYCPSACMDSSSIVKYKAVQGSANHCSWDLNCIKNEIFAHGPMDAGFDVYQDFFSYSKGIYQHVTGGYAGGHAIKIIGWGIEDEIKYWICANSWGVQWGDEGFFKILEGDCNIDSDVWFGLYEDSSSPFMLM